MLTAITTFTSKTIFLPMSTSRDAEIVHVLTLSYKQEDTKRLFRERGSEESR